MSVPDAPAAARLLVPPGAGEAVALVGEVVVPGGFELVVAVDTLAAGVHFPSETPPEDVAYKAVAVNLSDLAAMGARPATGCVSLTAPDPPAAWLDRFQHGLAEAAQSHGMLLDAAVRVDGPLAVTVQVHGLVEAGRALTRSAARPGDSIWVTGTLGDAGLALEALAGRARPAASALAHASRRLARPVPRVRTGRALIGVAGAVIDVSDGLAQDLGHILERSGVGADVDAGSIPLSPALRDALPARAALRLALTAGDDYELCFTVPPAREAALADAIRGAVEGATRIGTISAVPGLRIGLDGAPFEVGGGYRHFA